MARMSWVPVIDLSEGDASEMIADAAERVGFFSVIEHGVDAGTLIATRGTPPGAFFDLPLAEKMRVAMPRPGYPYGYSPIAGETLAASLGQRPRPT